MVESRVTIGRNISNDRESVELVANSLERLIELERDLLTESAEADDEGTNAMMSDFISEQEKTVWMLKAWLAQVQYMSQNSLFLLSSVSLLW